MSDRTVAVLPRPPGALSAGLAAAMLADVVDLVAETPLVASALAAPLGYDAAGALTWPGTIRVEVPADPTVAEVLNALAVMSEPNVLALAVVVADVPDLPTLLLGKLFSALAGPRGAAVAVCPAQGSGLVAVAANLPVVGWLSSCAVRLDDPDALDQLRAAAPLVELSVGPGWRRIREPGDVVGLDPGLEGWDATRAYLAAETA
jgi:hypothetical protein